jgi:nitrogen-specific signal transduction histidine kinase
MNFENLSSQDTSYLYISLLSNYFEVFSDLNPEIEIVYTIDVEDNGPGVPADLHEKIFEPLFSTKSFGVGLGMTVVKDIIQRHNGNVILQITRQKGCRFVVQIPYS